MAPIGSNALDVKLAMFTTAITLAVYCFDSRVDGVTLCFKIALKPAVQQVCVALRSRTNWIMGPECVGGQLTAS